MNVEFLKHLGVSIASSSLFTTGIFLGRKVEILHPYTSQGQFKDLMMSSFFISGSMEAIDIFSKKFIPIKQEGLRTIVKHSLAMLGGFATAHAFAAKDILPKTYLVPFVAICTLFRLTKDFFEPEVQQPKIEPTPITEAHSVLIQGIAFIEKQKDSKESIEGIFRIPPSSELLEEKVKQTEKSDLFDGVNDIHLVAGVMKRIIKNVNVIPKEKQNDFLSVIREDEELKQKKTKRELFSKEKKSKTDQEKIKEFNQLIQQLPKENKALLKELLLFLNKVATKEYEQAELDTCNSGVLWGPALFPAEPEDIVVVKKTTWGNLTVQFLIENVKALFS